MTRSSHINAFNVVNDKVAIFTKDGGHIEEEFEHESACFYRRQKDGLLYLFFTLDVAPSSPHYVRAGVPDAEEKLEAFKNIVQRKGCTYLTPEVYFLYGGDLRKSYCEV